MIGWRARIGAVQPSRGDTFSYEFYKMAPDGVVLVMAVTNVRELTEAELERALGEYEKASRILATEEVDIILVAGIPLLALKGGKGADIEIAKRIQEVTGIPAMHNLTAAVEALRKLNVRKLAVVTPYRDAVNLREKQIFEANDFEVVNIKGLQIERNVEIAMTPPYAAYRLAKETFREAPDAEGIFISCGRWQTVSFIESLERDLKIPVVSSAQAVIWAAFSRTGVGESKPGFGQLMRTL
ncbi:aspartate/glutamate racemase family protein [Thermodesulfobacteriota bacterium]